VLVIIFSSYLAKRFTMVFLDIDENRAVVVKKEGGKKNGSSITNEWVYGIDRRGLDDD
jgi:hypothetical protein